MGLTQGDSQVIDHVDRLQGHSHAIIPETILRTPTPPFPTCVKFASSSTSSSRLIVDACGRQKVRSIDPGILPEICREERTKSLRALGTPRKVLFTSMHYRCTMHCAVSSFPNFRLFPQTSTVAYWYHND